MKKSLVIVFIGLFMYFLLLANVYSLSKYNYHIKSVSKYFKNNVLEIQYNPWYSGGNDGLIIFTKYRNLSSKEKILLPNGKYIYCAMQVCGVYYSNSRGARVLPLSNLDKSFLETLDSNYNYIKLTGGIYTHCVNGNNNVNIDYNSMFGYVSWKSNKFILTGGLYIGYKIYKTGISLANFVNSVGYIGGFKFVGWIYDTTVGPGFMGGMFTGNHIAEASDVLEKMRQKSDRSMQDVLKLVGNNLKLIGNENYVISTNNTIINIVGNILVKGIVSISSFENNISDIFMVNNEGKINASKHKYKDFYRDIMSKLGNKKDTILFKSKRLNISKLLNVVRKNVNYLCEGNWSNEINNSKIINCINANGNTVMVDLSSLKKGSYIILKNGNLKIIGSVKSDSYYNVFVNNGKLILSNELIPINDVNKYGEAIVLNGNYLINGLIEGDGPGGIFNHQLIINGRLASLNTVGTPTPGKINMIKSIVDDTNVGANNINLNDIFGWSLEINGLGTDNRKPNPKYPNQALVVQHYIYKSKLFK